MLLRLTLSLVSAEDRVLGWELSEAFLCGGVFVIQSLLLAEDGVLGLTFSWSCDGVFVLQLFLSAEDRMLGLEFSEAFSRGDIFKVQSGGPVESSAVHKNGHNIINIGHTIIP